MAFSQSIPKGQTAVICQLCENEPKIKWKCLQCKLMMCQRCRDKVHPKFPSASDHTIIDIKDSRTQEEEPYLDFSILKCPVHKGQNCCLFCKTCMDLICPTCVTKTHKSHELVEIREGYEIQIKKVKSFNTEINTDIQNFSNREKNLDKLKLTKKSKYDKTKQEICDQEEAIIKAVKNYKDRLLNKLDQNWDDLQKSIEKEGANVKKKQKKLTEQREKVENILQSKDVQKTFSFSHDLFHSKEEKMKMSFYQIPGFVGGDLDGIFSLFGSLEEIKTGQDFTVQVLDHYKTDLYHVSCVSVCPDNTVWIGDGHVIRHVKLENQTTEIISEIIIQHDDMALLPSGDLLIATFDSRLKLVKQGNSQIKQTHNIASGMNINYVHVTPNNNIIVTASGYSEEDDESNQVIVMDQAGKILKVYEYDRDGDPLFTIASRVCSNSINNIAVVEGSFREIRVVVLNQAGVVINIYTGHPDVNNDDKPFDPRHIVATRSGNFIISDTNNHTLHILNDRGHGITYCNTKELVDGRPYSLAISGTNQLYIGNLCDDDNDNYEENAKIYKTDISGW